MASDHWFHSISLFLWRTLTENWRIAGKVFSTGLHTAVNSCYQVWSWLSAKVGRVCLSDLWNVFTQKDFPRCKDEMISLKMTFCFLFCSLKQGIIVWHWGWCAVPVSLELGVHPRVALNSLSFCLALQSAGVTGVYHHRWLIQQTFCNAGNCTCAWHPLSMTSVTESYPQPQQNSFPH